MKKRLKKYTVALVEEYPIFEHAEGGYYYAGQTVETIKCKSRNQAQKILVENAEVYGLTVVNDIFASNKQTKFIGEHTYIQIYRGLDGIPKNSGKVDYE